MTTKMPQISSHARGLIKSVTVHELIKSVQVTHPTNDGKADFLVNDIYDIHFTPDTLYLSDGSKQAVAEMKAITTAELNRLATVDGLETIQKTMTVEVNNTGWNYLKISDPSGENLHLLKVLREDGSEVSLETVWTTDRTFLGKGRPVYENNLHLLDFVANKEQDQYTFIYEVPKKIIANPDFITTTGGTPVILPLLANDVNIDNVPLSSDAISFLTLPQHGTLVEVGNKWVYYANANFTGEDVFSYQLNSPTTAASNEALVRVSVLPPSVTTETPLIPSTANDVLIGSSGDNLILGLGGNDVITGKGGNDIIDGGMGADRINGGTGNDTIYGGAGNDHLMGHSGNDILVGGTGRDFLMGGAGNDTYLFNAGDGPDRVVDFAGTDSLIFRGISPSTFAFSRLGLDLRIDYVDGLSPASFVRVQDYFGLGQIESIVVESTEGFLLQEWSPASLALAL